jgi:hypothetical protein
VNDFEKVMSQIKSRSATHSDGSVGGEDGGLAEQTNVGDISAHADTDLSVDGDHLVLSLTLKLVAVGRGTGSCHGVTVVGGVVGVERDGVVGQVDFACFISTHTTCTKITTSPL